MERCVGRGHRNKTPGIPFELKMAMTPFLLLHGNDGDGFASCETLDSYRDFLTWAFGGEPPMRFLTMSNAHPRICGHICSKVAELLFIQRSH